jgi:predicted phage terminase large subunit-like protein
VTNRLLEIKRARVKLLIQQKILKARDNFFEFCNLLHSDFFKRDRLYLIELCDTLQALYEKRIVKEDKEFKILSYGVSASSTQEVVTKLMINVPPQHGKTRTLVLFTAWCLGQNNKERILTVSYNKDTASDFSRYTRDTIALEQPDEYEVSYDDIFPQTKLKEGNTSFQKWAVEGSHFSYLGTGIGGSVTSKSGTIRIIDDPVKNSKEAFNINVLDDIWRFYTSTFMSRQSGDCIDIVNHTRWSDDDLCGRLLKRQPNDWYVFKKEAYDKETDKMLCEELLSRKNYENIRSLCDPLIFYANYHQTVIDASTKLYTTLRVYDRLPEKYSSITTYVDTADTGEDWLCAIIAQVTDQQCFVLDVYYTKEPMEITEEELAKRLNKYNVNVCHIESNNGGRGFARSVKKILKNTFKNTSVIVKWFHQSENKMSRILSHSTSVMQNVFFPAHWDIIFPEFYRDMNKFSSIKNEHDCCADSITGLVERVCKHYDSVRFLK